MDPSLLPVCAGIASVILVIIIVSILTKRKSLSPSVSKDASTSPSSKSSTASRAIAATPAPSKAPEIAAAEADLAVTLKGHTSEVASIAFSSNGKWLATASTDRTVRLWPAAYLHESNHRDVSVSLEGDEGAIVRFSHDDQRLVVALGTSREIAIYQYYEEKRDGKRSLLEVKFPTHHSLIKSMDVSKSAPRIVTCSPETQVKIWNFSGECIHQMDTNQMQNYTVSFSWNGKFFAIGTWTSEVKLLEMHSRKDNSLEKVTHAMTLVGHKKSVPAITFSADSSRVITASADGQMKCWNIEVRYQVREEPRELWSVNLPFAAAKITQLSVSPNDKAFVAVVDRDLHFFDLSNGTLMRTLHTNHQAAILDCSWSSDNSLMGTVASGERLVRLWKLSSLWK